eukprot:Skav219890  [mRNA]  locus=scaffold841:95156:102725:+ [translate_table: standard]
MARLSALAVSDAVAAFQAAGLGDTRDFDALTEVLLTVRNRVRASPASEELASQRTAIQRCVQPLVQWLEAEADVSALDVLRKTELLWNLYLSSALEQWLNSSAAPLVIPCLTTELQIQLLAAAASVTLLLPSIQSATENLDLLSEFNATKVWAHLTADGRTQVHYELVHLRFAVYWANPLWTNLDLDLATERDQILRLLRLAVISLPSPTPTAGIRTLDLEVHVSWPVLVSKLKMFTRQLLMTWSVVLTDTLRGEGTVSFMWWLLPPLYSLLLLIMWHCYLRWHWHSFAGFRWEGAVVLAVQDGTAEDDEATGPLLPPSPDVHESSVSGGSSFTLLSDVKSEVSSDTSFLFEAGGHGVALEG